MKIIQVFNRYLDKGGEENSVSRIARNLEFGGHEVERFWRSSEEWSNINSPSNFQKAKLMWRNNRVLNELRSVHIEEKADCWILHNVLPVISLGVYDLAKELDVPIIQWLHNYRPLSISGTHPNGNFSYFEECLTGAWRGSRIQTSLLGLYYLHAFRRKKFDHVKAWVAVSQNMKSIFDKQGWYQNRLYTLHHSWDIGEITPESRERDYFLFLGRLIEEKGIRFLVNLFSLPELQRIKLVVAGDGPLKEELMKQSTQNVEWVGFIDGAKKRELIRHSKSVLFPSTWPEPLSTIAYEAFEQERCIIANSTGGMPEIIENGRTGFLLEPDNQKQWINVLTSQTTESLDDFGKEGRLWLQQNVSAMNWNKGLDSIIRKAL